MVILLHMKNLLKIQFLNEIKTLAVNKTREDSIDISKFNSLNKLYRVTAWIKRFVNNVWNEKENQELLLKPFLTSNELRNSESYRIKKNQESIDNKQVELLRKQLNVRRDENDLLICTGRLEKAPLPYESKTPYLISRHSQTSRTNCYQYPHQTKAYFY